MRKLLLSVLLSSAIAFPAIAAPIQYVNLTEDAVVPVTLRINRPMHIKAPRGTRFYKGWLDNNLIAEVDSDRPWEQGATLIYLVGRASGSATLSLMARDSGGNETLVLVQLRSGSKVGPEIVAFRSKDAITGKIGGITPADALSDGIAAATANGAVVPGSSLYTALIRFTALVRQGSTAQRASQETGVDLQVIEKILGMGRNTPLRVPAKARVFEIAAKLPAPPPLETKIPALVKESRDKRPPAEVKPTVQVAPPQFNFNFSPIPLTSDYQVPAETLKPVYDTNLVKPKKQKAKRRKKLNPIPVESISSPPAKIVTAISVPITAVVLPRKTLSSHSLANGLVRGLMKARREKDRQAIASSRRVQDAIFQLRKGRSFDEACRRSGVSGVLGKKLLKLGGVVL